MQNPNVPLYIFDMDGTLSLPDHRRHLVEAPACPMCLGHKTMKAATDMSGGAGHSIAVDVTCPTCNGKGKAKDFTPNWNLFYQSCAIDAPNHPVIGLLLQLYQIGADIQIWSGREDSVRDLTIEWMYSHLHLQPYVSDKMLVNMRPTGDYTPDHQLKRKWLHMMPPVDRKRLAGVFDDRQKVVDMWREEGLTCFQVAPGNF